MWRAWLILLVSLCCLSGQASIKKCSRFVLAFSGLIQESNATWESPLFAPGAVQDPSRLMEIYTQMQSPYSQMGRDVAAYLATRSPDDVRALRADLVDLFNILDGDYQALLDKTDQALWGARRIADLGCGTGMFCAYLTMEAEPRHIIAVDHEAHILRALGRRVAMTPNSTSTVEVRNIGFRQLTIEPASLDGAVISLTFFHLPLARKRELLTQVHSWLKPGAKLVLNDWVLSQTWTMRDDTAVRLLQLLEDGYPLSEFQYALWVAVHSGIFYRRLGPDYDEDAQPLFAQDLPVLLREHGFEAGEAEMVGASGVAMVIGTKAGP